MMTPSTSPWSALKSVGSPVTTLNTGVMTQVTSMITPSRRRWARPRADPRLLGAVDAVAGVAQAGDDVAVGIEVAVDCRGIDGHVGMVAMEVRQPLGAGEQAHELDRAG